MASLPEGELRIGSHRAVGTAVAIDGSMYVAVEIEMGGCILEARVEILKSFTALWFAGARLRRTRWTEHGEREGIRLYK